MFSASIASHPKPEDLTIPGAGAFNALSGKAPRLLLLIAGLTVVLFSVVALARIVERAPTASGDSRETDGETAATRTRAAAPDEIGKPPQTWARKHVRARCDGCGSVVSVRELETAGDAASRASDKTIGRLQSDGPAGPARRYEFTVRLGDGSNRVFSDSNPTAWRIGERVGVIDGLTVSSR